MSVDDYVRWVKYPGDIFPTFGKIVRVESQNRIHVLLNTGQVIVVRADQLVRG